MGNGSVLKAEQVKELGSAVLQQMPVDIPPEDYEYWVTHKSELGPALSSVLIRQRSVVQPQIKGTFAAGKLLADLGRSEFWSEMWQYLGWEFNPTGLLVPTEQDGHSWLIGMPQSMTDNKSFELNAGNFNCWRWTDDLDAAIVHNDRHPKNGAYFIRVRNRIEADKELKNLSAKVLWDRQIPGITHMEREVLEQAVWLVSGKHLDIENVTLCHGSRYSFGGVPGVGWVSDYDWLQVDRCHPGFAHGCLRGRSVVSK